MQQESFEMPLGNWVTMVRIWCQKAVCFAGWQCGLEMPVCNLHIDLVAQWLGCWISDRKVANQLPDSLLSSNNSGQVLCSHA